MDHVKVYLIHSKEIKIKVVLEPTVPIPTIQTQKKTELPSTVTKATNTCTELLCVLWWAVIM